MNKIQYVLQLNLKHCYKTHSNDFVNVAWKCDSLIENIKFHISFMSSLVGCTQIDCTKVYTDLEN